MNPVREVVTDFASNATGVQPHPRRRSSQPVRSVFRKRYKLAAMLHHALMGRVQKLVDPSGHAETIREVLMGFPDVEAGTHEYIAQYRYDRLQSYVCDLCRRLRNVRDLVEQLDTCSGRLISCLGGRLPTVDLPMPTIPSLMSDIEAMERSFVRVLVGPKMIGVVTEDIVLEHDGAEFNFGPFKIVIDLHSYATRAGAQDYFIRACSPRHPNNGSSMEHPHVLNAVLCEGNARVHIEHALDEGRFFDFFHIVNNTLQVYNASSPHLRLRFWTRETDSEYECVNCGAELDEDDYSTCEICEQIFCGECLDYCDTGQRSICNSCIEHSSGCYGCDDFGAEGCRMHENDPCEICGEIMSDNDMVYCDGEYTFCRSCIETATELPEICNGCSYRERCVYLPDELKEDDESEEEEESEEDPDDDTTVSADSDGQRSAGSNGREDCQAAGSN